MINTVAYSFVATAYPREIEKVVAWMETMVCGGCTIGPILGCVIYNAVGFSITFFIFGLIMISMSVLVPLMLSKPELAR